ncbi:hypothetical protein VSX64_08700 [Aurantimonas sp. C2-6-R+9]|uniref:hypothetical protein n=1 Tax=unclassified Aurantimonas TaxID=2638230 RepID=UPI002E1731BE|nr:MULTISPECIES: hypothetical protein [unclassified Aurantimonas]MEC5291220.1 hypothetical protein [Aurantimonas sp. C2-3-R2]MEC5380961.1 hypothetical protein [Aurantimonas sp. C2-6-R+9]MEC5412289.1 hypothetical protein [Aurantimonas sp. C2-4-R8]
MSQRDRGSVHTAVTAIFLIIIIASAIGAIWSVASRTTRDRIQAEAAAQEHARHADQEIERRCAVAQGPRAVAVCVREIIESTNEEKRAERDLAAQSGMDEWAFWMMWASFFSAGVTGLGVYWVKETLAETRHAVKAADDAVVVTREIGRAQTRAYLHVASATFHAEPQNFVIELKLKNSGPTPARIRNIGYHLMIYETTLNNSPMTGPYDPAETSVTPVVAAVATDTAVAYWSAENLGSEIYGKIYSHNPRCTVMVDLVWVDVYNRE